MPDEQPRPNNLRDAEAAATRRPAWRNARGFDGCFRSYGGGGDADMRIEGDVLRITVRRTSRFVLWFGCLFVPALTAVAWLAVNDRNTRVAVGFLGPACGLLTFGLTYALFTYHEKLGDYLVLDRSAGIVRLPRVSKAFRAADVVCFQSIRGRSKSDWDVNTDLNLLVADPAYGVVRYHVMGDPPPDVIRTVAAFSGIRVDKVDLGWRGDRDADAGTPAGGRPRGPAGKA